MKKGFKKINGFPFYCINRDGVIMTCYRRGPRSDEKSSWRVISSNGGGRYANVTLVKEGVKHTRYVHRLVLETFFGPCPPGMECLHADDNPRNPTLSNLSWGTRKKNAGERVAKGRQVRGENHGRAVLSIKDVLEIRASAHSGREAAHKYKVSKSTISRIKNGKLWKHLQEL